MASSSHSYNSPCAACKFLRRKCMPGCIFAPYFPPEEPQKFINVHKIFGASNVTKLLNELLPHQREDAVNSLAYEAEARVHDPVYGCVGAISYLQRQVERLQKELDAANADLIRYACCEIQTSMHVPLLPINETHNTMSQTHNTIMSPCIMRSPVELITTTTATTRRVSNHEIGGMSFYQAPPHFQFPYSTPHLWSENINGAKGEGSL